MRSCCERSHFKPLEPYIDCCVYCGATFLRAMAIPKERHEDPKPAYDDRTKTLVFDVVSRHYQFITELRESNISWEVVTRRLADKSGARLQKDRVAKYFVVVGQMGAGGR